MPTSAHTIILYVVLLIATRVATKRGSYWLATKAPYVVDTISPMGLPSMFPIVAPMYLDLQPGAYSVLLGTVYD
jgi:hypothetical protein